MDDSENNLPPASGSSDEPATAPELIPQPEISLPSYGAAQDPPRSRRLRRLGTLFLTTLVAFGLTTWVMVRIDNPATLFGFGPAPSSVVRTHLQALNRGDLREAYGQFSDAYRGTHSFDAYHDLVVNHWNIFRTRRVSFRELTSTGNRVLLEAQMLASDGRRYTARFSVVREAKRWWIDDIRWGVTFDGDNLIQT